MVHDVTIISIHKDVNLKKNAIKLILLVVINPLATTCEHHKVYQSDTKTDTSMQEEALGKARMI